MNPDKRNIFIILTIIIKMITMAEGYTTIPVKLSTKKMLRAYGISGETYDTILKRLMSDNPTPVFIAEMYRRHEEDEKISLDEVKKLLKVG